MTGWLHAEGHCDLIALVVDLSYMQAAAGGCHTVLLRCEGTAAACIWKVAGLMYVIALRWSQT